MLTPAFISSRNLDYTILDISENELGKAPDQYKKLAQDIMANDLSSTERFDLVLPGCLRNMSRMENCSIEMFILC